MGSLASERATRPLGSLVNAHDRLAPPQGWLGLHLVALVGFRNRATVLLNWAWNYVTWDRGNRIILRLGEERQGARVD